MRRQSLRKRIFLFTAAILQLSLLASALMPKIAAQEQTGSLQQRIDQASPGDTLVLEAGEYAGPIVIEKELRIQGSREVILTHKGEEPTVEIRADRVVLEGLRVTHALAAETSAIAVYADEVTLSKLEIETENYGILLRDADRGILTENRIIWAGAKRNDRLSFGQKSNGIDLYNAHDTRIAGNEIHSMRDGIYLENSHRSLVENNRIYRSRYGVHCMYTNGTQIKGNIGELENYYFKINEILFTPLG